MPTSADSVTQTVGQAIDAIYQQLLQCPSTTPRLDAELIVGHVLQKSRTWLLIHWPEALNQAQSAEVESLTFKRVQGWPIAYLTGKREFGNLDFSVGPGVLVPRPETEQLVDIVLRFFDTRLDTDTPVIVDVGTGSGAIALAVAEANLKSAPRIIASDRSLRALSYAHQNASDLGIQNIELVAGDLLRWLGTPVDVVVANLPYLRPDQVDQNWELSQEPFEALVSGSDGLDLQRRLLVETSHRLKPDGFAAFELDPSNIRQAREHAHTIFPNATIEIIEDLSGQERFLTVTTHQGHRIPVEKTQG
jgi:release factor glutamine methyltransferase